MMLIQLDLHILIHPQAPSRDASKGLGLWAVAEVVMGNICAGRALFHSLWLISRGPKAAKWRRQQIINEKTEEEVHQGADY